MFRKLTTRHARRHARRYLAGAHEVRLGQDRQLDALTALLTQATS